MSSRDFFFGERMEENKWQLIRLEVAELVRACG
jgi:hypothetical protein